MSDDKKKSWLFEPTENVIKIAKEALDDLYGECSCIEVIEITSIQENIATVVVTYEHDGTNSYIYEIDLDNVEVDDV